MMFDETDDLDFGSLGFPQLFFFDGALTSFGYIVETEFNGIPIQVRGGLIAGDQALFTSTDGSVPVPGTAVLTLLGLGLLARRRRQ